MRFVLEHHGNASGAQKSKIALIRLVAVTIALELLLSASSQYDALWKLSYKSTSVISFILAAASVAAAALHQPRHEVPAADKTIMQERSLSTPYSRLPAMSGDPSLTKQSAPWRQASKRESPIQPAPFCSESL